jgi:hypothetical protein
VYSDQAHLSEPLVGGLNPLELTIARIARCRRLGEDGDGSSGVGHARIIILTDAPNRAAAWLTHRPDGCEIRFIQAYDGFLTNPRRAGVRAARLTARDCWRGGIANQSVYDEVFDAAALRALAAELDLHAVLLIGPDWSAVDPELCDAIIERYRRNPGHSRFTFTQAPPGVCGCVLSRSLLNDFADAEGKSGVFASIGGLLGYIPWTPIVDLINLPECVAIEPRLRDIGRRIIADSPQGRSLIAGLYQRAGTPEAINAAAIADAVGVHAASASCPSHLVLTIAAADGSSASRWMDATTASAAMGAFRESLLSGPGVVTLRAADPLSGVDPLDHPDFAAIVSASANAGFAVHLRTPLTSERFEASRLTDGRIAVISADVLATTDAAYLRVTGRDDGARVRTRYESLLATRTGAWSVPWIIPRLTRCDASYGEIDPFFRPQLIAAGWAVIDPLDAPRLGERIAPLPVPATAQRRFAAGIRVIGIDGRERPHA